MDTIQYHPEEVINVNGRVSDWPFRLALFLKQHDYKFSADPEYDNLVVELDRVVLELSQLLSEASPGTATS